jgi:hypothetical protein
MDVITIFVTDSYEAMYKEVVYQKEVFEAN